MALMPRLDLRARQLSAFSELLEASDLVQEGMLRALEKRPVSVEDLEAAISRLCHRLRATGEREVPARQVGGFVMEALQQLDDVAYVRFASVYRSFQDISEFAAEVDRLRGRAGGGEPQDDDTPQQ